MLKTWIIMTYSTWDVQFYSVKRLFIFVLFVLLFNISCSLPHSCVGVNCCVWLHQNSETICAFVCACVCVCVRFSPSTFNVIFLAPFLLINPWPSLSDWTKCQCCAVTQRQKSIHLRQFLSTDSRDKSEKRFVWACRGVHTGRPYSSVRSAAEWRKKHREHTLHTKHFVIDWIYL